MAIRRRADNLVYNGDFEYTPPFTALTGGTGWISGNASASVDDQYGWYFVEKANNSAAGFDPTVSFQGGAALKLSTLDVTGRVIVSPFPGDPAASSFNINLLRKYGIPCLPNTQYRLSFRAKTNNIITGGVGQLMQYDSDGVKIVTSSGQAIDSNSDWKEITITVTTQSNAAFLNPIFLLNTAGNAADLWIDNVVLAPTSSINGMRTLADGRTRTTSRTKVRDFGTCLRFEPVTTNKVTIPNTEGQVYNNHDLTISMWVKKDPRVVAAEFLFAHPGSGNNRVYLNFPSASSMRLNMTFGSGGFNPVAFLKERMWSHVLARFDRTNSRISCLINGEVALAPTTVAAVTDTGLTDIYIGNQSAGATQSAGAYIDEVLVFDYILEDAEGIDIYRQSKYSRENLNLEYLFNEGSGTDALDTSNYDNNGVITGATYSLDVPIIERTRVS